MATRVLNQAQTLDVTTRLIELRKMTRSIVAHETAASTQREARRLAALEARDAGATYDQMAAAMGMSDVAVFKILRGKDETVPAKPDKKVAVE